MTFSSLFPIHFFTDYDEILGTGELFLYCTPFFTCFIPRKMAYFALIFPILLINIFTSALKIFTCTLRERESGTKKFGPFFCSPNAAEKTSSRASKKPGTAERWPARKQVCTPFGTGMDVE
uniref:(northern house mosquito) hypothetical protein n=1 Tax=Culex pipiens TaxID=7175 RepID=A0A8D7ZVV7_CULPI